jgi:hypothetical protein
MNEDMVESIVKLEEGEHLPAGEIVQTPSYSEADIAASFFSMQAPRLDKLLNKMSAKQLRRLIFNASSYPLVDRKYNPKTQDERDAAYLIAEMVLNRSIMQLHFEMQRVEEDLQKKAESDKLALVNETKEENNE